MDEIEEQGRASCESSENVAQFVVNDTDAMDLDCVPAYISDIVELDVALNNPSEDGVIFDENFEAYMSMFHPELVESPLRVHSPLDVMQESVYTFGVSDTDLLESVDSFIESDMINDLNSFFA